MSIGLAISLLFAALLSLTLAGLLAAADSALHVRSRSEIYRMAEGSRRSDRSLRAIADDEQSHINAVSFTRIIAESLAAVFITVVLAYTIDQLWLTLITATLVLVVSTLLLVGASPRAFGANYPERVLRLTANLVRFLGVLLSPLSAMISNLTGRVATRAENLGESTEADKQILSLVDRAAERQQIEEDDRNYIRSLMRLGDTLVRELMVPRTDMQTVAATDTVRQALEQLLSSRHSRMPIIATDVDDVLGMVYLRDASGFVLRYGETAETAHATRIMKPAMFVPDLMRADDLLQQMQRESQHLALTVDEYGGISGLITLEDILESLIGDISDEHDREDPDTELLSDGTFALNPRVTVTELGELFGIEIDDDEVDTVAGLLVKELGKLAEAGDTVDVAGIRLTVTEADRRNTITAINARWIGDAEEPEAVTAQAARGAAEDSGERTPGAAENLGETQTAPAGGAAQTFGEQGKGDSND